MIVVLLVLAFIAGEGGEGHCTESRMDPKTTYPRMYEPYFGYGCCDLFPRKRYDHYGQVRYLGTPQDILCALPLWI